MFGNKKSLWKDTRGAVLAYTAILMPIFLGFMALGLDIASWHIEKRASQSMADAAAVAGSIQLFRMVEEQDETDPSCDSGDEVYSAAATTAGFNLYATSKGQTLTLNCPALFGDAAGTAGSVEAIVTTPLPLFLAALVNVTATGKKAASRAVAGAGLGDSCIFALDEDSGTGVDVSGGASLTMSCGVRSNTSGDHSVDTDGTSCIIASEIISSGDSTGCLDPEPVEGAVPAADPLADLPEPENNGCDFNTPINVNGSANRTLNPGVYCADIRMNSSGVLTMNPGIYIFDGMTFRITKGTVNAYGVMIFYTNSTTPNSLDISGGTINLTAPTSGTYQGIAIYVDRDDTTGYTMTFSAATGANIEGVIYAKNQTVSYTGQAGTEQSIYIIANKISLSGGGTITNLNADGDPIFYSSYLVRGQLVE